MSEGTLSYAVIAVAVLVSISSLIGLVLVPIYRSYDSWADRIVGMFLGSIIILAFALGGLYLGLTVVDKFLS